MNKKSLLFGVLILLAFCIIIWACSLVGNALGPWGENIALGLIAVLLFAGFIKSRKEAQDDAEKKKN